MTAEATNPDELPNGTGEGDTSSEGSDTASGGSADEQTDRPPVTEQPDGMPVENPSGG